MHLLYYYGRFRYTISPTVEQWRAPLLLVPSKPFPRISPLKFPPPFATITTATDGDGRGGIISLSFGPASAPPSACSTYVPTYTWGGRVMRKLLLTRHECMHDKFCTYLPTAAKYIHEPGKKAMHTQVRQRGSMGSMYVPTCGTLLPHPHLHLSVSNSARGRAGRGFCSEWPCLGLRRLVINLNSARI